MNLFFRQLIRKPVFWFTLALVAVGLFWFYRTQYRDNARQKVETLRSRVWHELAVAALDQKSIAAACKRATLPGPALLPVSVQYPYCVFRNGSIVYWSDNQLVPSYNQLGDGPNVRLVSLPTGRFLARRLAFKAGDNETEIYSLIPLERRFRVQNEYLRTGFNPHVVPYNDVEIGTEISRNGANIYSPDARFLFSVELPEQASEHQRDRFFIFFSLVVLTVAAAGVALASYLYGIRARRDLFRYERGFAALAVYVLVVRLLMLRFSIPNALFPSDLFDPRYYASSAVAPSIGDLLLNCMAGLAVAAYAVRYFFRSQACRLVLQLSLRGRWVVAGLLLLGGFGLLSLHFHFLRTLPLYSQINLDITESIRFPVFRVLCLGVYCINSVLFFLGGYLTLRLSLQFRLPFHWFLAAVVASSVVYVLLAYLTYEFHPEIIIIGGAYWLLGYYFQMPRSVGRLTYRTSIYFFMTAAFCAGLGAWAVYEMERNKNLADKTDFARKLLSENDPLGEYLLHEASENIKKDAFIRSRLLGPVVSKRDIITKVKRHLGSYFDRYEVNVKVFDPLGLNLQGDDYPQSYADYVVNFQRQENGRYVYGTAYDNLYFKPSVGGSVIGEYVSLITLMQGNTIIGFVTVDLQQKRVVLSDVYPGLLLDSRLVAPPASRNYSYAIYGGRKLIYNEGIFNYVRDFSPAKLSDEQLSGGGLVEDGYQHIGVHDPKNKRTVVVSSVQYRFARVFSNFSFLFLILVLVAGGYLFLYAVYYQAPLARTGFSTRIQIYLNLAFFLPLITVSVVTVSLLSANYRENLTQSYFDTAENIADELRFRLDDLLKSGQITEYLASEIDEMARHTQSDVNIFGTDGRLLLSSQNQIYENGLLSPYVNRQAWHAIARQNHIRQQLSESVGRLQYNSVYVGIRDPDDKRLLGILSIPFFDSRAELDEQIIEVLSVILDIFTLVFIGFLALSYLASRLLTVPLQLIAQKLAKTSLQTENEPLVWNSDDEIGLLVGEYNRMVRNLEESKQALARGEKESAWREMAQQVAHEIKNPLTPMKLTLQHLQRTLMSQSPDTVDRAGRSIATLIEQVDTLSDIATSFSAFAKMPIPKEERFDVAEVLRQTTNLYGTDPTVRLETDIAEKSCPVKGDAQLMSRIFTNLIINGIQSVPEGRQPHIGVSLHRQNGHVIVTVADNGTGIPDTIRSKVFLPHFSTKMSGSGIGLAVAKRGVEHAGGQIWFETVAGEGTTFYVQLPVVNSE